MRFYTGNHPFYCGIDLHTKTMHLCILDQTGNVLVDRNLATHAKAFLEAIGPYRDEILVGVESMFSWYWLSDLCQDENIAFVLGHASYMRLIHGGKGKNDRLDASKIARLLLSKAFPMAYAYPQGMRETRDLLRRRTQLVRIRGGLLTHVKIVNSQYNLPPLAKQLLYESNQEGIVERFPEGSLRQNVTLDLGLINHLTGVITELEQHLLRTVQVEDQRTYERLQTTPGIGRVLGLVLLYEMHDWRRFGGVGAFLSYARLVRCVHESAGKRLGAGNNQIGNPHVKWAFGEAACQLLRVSERARKWKQRYQQTRGAGRAMSVLAAKLARALYHMLRKGEDFDEERFWNTGRAAERQRASAGKRRVKRA